MAAETKDWRNGEPGDVFRVGPGEGIVGNALEHPSFSLVVIYLCGKAREEERKKQHENEVSH